MAEATIPVDLRNPGQVFACLGFLEAADILLGDAEGGFDWSDDTGTRFRLRADDGASPVEYVLHYLAHADIRQFCPAGYDNNGTSADSDGTELNDDEEGDDDGQVPELEVSAAFPSASAEKTTLPIRLVSNDHPTIELSHWADGSGRNTFKLYSGNRSASGIARAMLRGTRKKPSKKQRENGEQGDLKTLGLVQLWSQDRHALANDPFNVLTPIGGSFNFDPRGAWTAIDAGYSPNTQKNAVEASPVVEILGALGMQHARPVEFGVRGVRYAVWGCLLPPKLARAALAGGIPSIPMRCFNFVLALSGKNKVVTFSQEELSS